MSKVAIYEAALKTMADNGNEQAKMALAMACSVRCPDINSASSYMQQAVNDMQAAIRSNATKWTSDTDSYIGRATSNITSALRALIVS